MASTKIINLPYYQTGVLGLYARVQQVSTSFWLDNADGVFRAVPTQINIPLVESVKAPSVYIFSDARTVWANGEYQAYGYDAGGSLFAGAEFFILDDVEVSQADLLAFTQFMRKIERNNWQLVGNQWVVFDDDGVTPLLIFNVFDQSGNPSMVNIFKRVRV